MYYKKHVFVCTNQKASNKPCCANQGGLPFVDYLKDRLKAIHAFGPGQIRVTQSGCLGRCALGPCLVVYPEGLWYTYSSEADIDEIIESVLLKGQHIERLAI